MLSRSEEQAFAESIDRVDRRATDALRAIEGAARAVAFVTNLHVGVDRIAAKAAASGVAIACEAGCSHCCHARVEATDPEILSMARWIRRQPDRYVADLCARLRERTTAGVDVRRGCAFLVDDRCSAYDVRPSTCRRAHSLSVAACASRAAEIPQDLALAAEAEALMIGTARAYRRAGLASSPRELNAAVLAALEDERSEEHWYAERSLA